MGRYDGMAIAFSYQRKTRNSSIVLIIVLRTSSTYLFETLRTMHFTPVSIIALLSTAGVSYGADAGIAQQILGNRPTTSVEPVATITSTRTIHITLTSTTHMFLPELPEATAPAPVQQQPHHHSTVPTWYGGQRNHGCDDTACASCRFWYMCSGGEPSWYVDYPNLIVIETLIIADSFQCDISPYCRECVSPQQLAAPVFEDDDEYDEDDDEESMRTTCSLGPDIDVPCNIDLSKAEYNFDGNRLASVKIGGSSGGHRTCSRGPGRTVPCDGDEPGKVFVFGDRRR